MSENTLCLLRSAAEFSRIQAAKRLNREAGLNFPRPENARVGYIVAVGTKEGFGDAPGDTRSWIGTASSDGKKKSSLYIQILSRASNEIYLASLLVMEHLSTTLFTLFTLLSNEFYPFDERIQTERLLRDLSMNRFAVCLGWDRLCLLHFSYLARARLEC